MIAVKYPFICRKVLPSDSRNVRAISKCKLDGCNLKFNKFSLANERKSLPGDDVSTPGPRAINSAHEIGASHRPGNLGKFDEDTIVLLQIGATTIQDANQ